MIKRTLALAIFATTPAYAGQPIYVSMAECAGIMRALTDQMETPGPRRERLVQAALNWDAAAHAEAGQDVSALIDQKATQWRDKGATVVFTEDFKDWAKYCRSLAKHKGLKIDPGK
ncbi:hypothetical protein C8N43_1343 [Litoreibacter ponti]|uniref:Uncharacterized protein n=1 Tax=Litoreibacter ponti TaxID=1510457 RepID=A0A2T6BKU6_9RHOB|nr:hypothetical protein [Litoreibacter ponti]PTX56681.1 hypothetical protein C8N43_1343 [Litoreibacter ponti]